MNDEMISDRGNAGHVPSGDDDPLALIAENRSVERDDMVADRDAERVRI